MLRTPCKAFRRTYPNAAMKLAKKAGMKPRDLAELFAAELTNADGIKSVEVAGPGYVNITLDSA